MNVDPLHPESPDAVDAAVAALRGSAIPEGPSPELILRTQAALRQEMAQPLPGRLFIGGPMLLRLAASIVLLLGAGWLYWSLHRQNSPIANPSDLQIVKGVPHVAPVLRPGDVAPRSPTPDPLVAPSQTQPAPTPAVPEPALADGLIAGRVIFAGPVPRPTVLASVAMLPDCMKLQGGPIYDESLVVGHNGALANVVITVSDGLSGWLREEFPPQSEPSILEQDHCTFRPHVVALMVGQQLLIRNNDCVLHNVHLLAVNNPPLQLGQPSITQANTAPFGSPDIFQARCDSHPWMQAWVHVVDNPYFAVTGPDGRFTLHGLPSGEYTIKAWHERLGVCEQQVYLQPGRGAALDFTFRPLPQ